MLTYMFRPVNLLLKDVPGHVLHAGSSICSQTFFHPHLIKSLALQGGRLEASEESLRG